MGGLLREVGQLTGATLHGRERLVVAGRGPQPQPRPDLVRTPTSRAGPVPQPRARRTARSLNPAPGRGNMRPIALASKPESVGYDTFAGITVVSARTRVVRSNLASEALASNTSFNPSTAVAPQRVVSFIKSSDAAPRHRAGYGRTAAT